MTEDQGWRRSFERDQDVINEAGIVRVREALAAALNTNPPKRRDPRPLLPNDLLDAARAEAARGGQARTDAEHATAAAKEGTT